jgi:hypothetical protein
LRIRGRYPGRRWIGIRLEKGIGSDARCAILTLTHDPALLAALHSPAFSIGWNGRARTGGHIDIARLSV